MQVLEKEVKLIFWCTGADNFDNIRRYQTDSVTEVT